MVVAVAVAVAEAPRIAVAPPWWQVCVECATVQAPQLRHHNRGFISKTPMELCRAPLNTGVKVAAVVAGVGRNSAAATVILQNGTGGIRAKVPDDQQ